MMNVRDIDAHPARVKADCNRGHARLRAAQRYGLELSHGDILALEAEIMAGGPNAVPLKRDDKGRDRTAYAWKSSEGRWLPVMFDDATSSVVTFLPERVLDPYWAKLEPAEPAATPSPLPESPKPTPFVPVILGRIEVPDSLGGLPDVAPFPGAYATEGEVLAVRETYVARADAVRSRLSAENVSGYHKRTLTDEYSRLSGVFARLKRLRSEARTRDYARVAGLSDPSDLASLIGAALTTLRQFGAKLGWEITDEQRAVLNLVSEADSSLNHAKMRARIVYQYDEGASQ